MGARVCERERVRIERLSSVQLVILTVKCACIPRSGPGAASSSARGRDPGGWDLGRTHLCF